MNGVPAILLVGAMRREFDGLTRHCRNLQRVGAEVDWAQAADLGGQRILMTANGAGPKLAGQALRRVHGWSTWSAVVSVGYCGALDPRLRTGDIVVGTHLLFGNDSMPLRLPETGRRHSTGPIISVDRIVASAEEKSALGQGGAMAVEMEAAGLAPLVRQWNLPLFCIRSVTDRADEGFVLDINRARSPEGRIQPSRLVLEALFKPVSGIPELLRLQQKSSSAALSLGDFLADCRF
ncbi:MAG: hypothetical protein ACKV22_11835 [Bryobacteraceae bacterium]